MVWFKEGLRFTCTGCGQCCTKEPGYVWVSEEEVRQMADHLAISPGEFKKRYTRDVFGRTSLREDSKNFDCIFLKEKRCQIYASRPRQCKTFPWWKENVATKEAWEETARRCEGINHPEALVVSCDTILENL